MTGNVRDEGGRRHSRLRSHFQQIEFARTLHCVVIPQISAADAPAAKRSMGAQRDVEGVFIDPRRDRRGSQMVGSPNRIFRRVIIEATARNYFADANCSIAHNRYGEFAARYKALYQHLIAEIPTSHFVAPT